jgi:hypothetical protein
VCDIPCYITKIGIYHLLYTNHDWYIPVMVGISHDPTFQMYKMSPLCRGITELAGIKLFNAGRVILSSTSMEEFASHV